MRAQSRALSNAADEILAREPVKPARFQPLTPPEAVLVYATDFLPSWAGAISIDLLPAVLVFIMIIVEGAIRRHDGVELDAEMMTAADVMRGAAIFKQMEERFGRNAVAVEGAENESNVAEDTRSNITQINLPGSSVQKD